MQGDPQPWGCGRKKKQSWNCPVMDGDRSCACGYKDKSRGHHLRRPLALLMHCLSAEKAASPSSKTVVECYIEKLENSWVPSEDEECDGSPGPHLLCGKAG